MNRKRIAEIALYELRWVAFITLVGTCLVTMLGFLAPLHWTFEALSNFREIAFSTGALGGAFLLLHRAVELIVDRGSRPDNTWRAFLFVAVVTLAINAVWVAPYVGVSVDESAEITVATANVFVANKTPLKAASWAVEANADIIALPELRSETATRLDAHYPYVVLDRDIGQSHHMPLGLYSKYPLRDVDVWFSPAVRRPIIDAVVEHPAGEFRVLAAHPIPSLSREFYRDRLELLSELVHRTRFSKLPVVVVGDLNITMFSPGYKALKRTGLINSREGRSVAGTWPRGLLLRIPIDHVLHSSHFRTTSLEVGGDTGSDHLPMVVGLRFSGEN